MTIQSEIELPELQKADDDHQDILIKTGKVVDHLPTITKSGPLFELSKNDFLFNFNTIAKYRVQNGNLITVQENKEAKHSDVRIFLYGSTFGALLHQRGMLPLHGSAFNSDNGAIICIGYSSSGKSTLAASFASAGYDVITDDISALEEREDGEFVIYPGIPSLKLWKDVLRKMKLEKSLIKVREQIEKFQLPITNQSPKEYYPIDKIILLETHNKSEYSLEKVTGVEKFQVLKDHTFRTNYIDGLDVTRIQFKNITSLAKKYPLYTIRRPTAPLQINELRDFVIRNIILDK